MRIVSVAMIAGALGFGLHVPAALAAGGPAAEQRAFEPAPVPSVDPPGLSPADRVAGPGSPVAAGPVNSTPFSGTPTGLLSGGGEQGSQHDRTLAPADQTGVVPNVGK